MIRLVYFLIFLTVLSALSQIQPKRSESGAIIGIVAGEEGRPVADAQVSLVGVNRFDVTNNDGFFEIAPLPAGTYTLLVEHISYEKQKVTEASVRQNEITVLDTIYLQPIVRQAQNVVVTARREGRVEVEIANALNLVERLDLEKRQVKTTAEALREESGVFVQKTNHGGGSAIIRGLSSNQVLLLVDGIRLNNSTYRLGNHQYLTTVDYHSLQRIEVLRGPGSVLHGSDALGGTINMITRKPDFETGQWQWRSSFAARYASADSEKSSNLRLSGGNNEWVVSGGFSYKNFGDLRQGSNVDYKRLLRGRDGSVQKPTAFTAWDADAKVIWEPQNSRRQWVLAWQHSDQQDVPRYDKYAYDGDYLWTYDPQVRDLLYLKLRQKTDFALAHTLQATLSRQLQKEGRNTRATQNAPLTEERDETTTLGFTLQANGAWHKQLLSYGVDFYLDDVSSMTRTVTNSGNSTSTRGRHPDGARYNSLGLFLEDEYHPSDKWILSGGLRYSRFATRFDTDELGEVDQTFNALTTSASAIYRLSAVWNLSAAISQGFRAPNLSDIGKLGESKGSVYEVPNPDLDPEKAMNYELGIKGFGNDYRVEVSAWYMDISNLIASADDTYLGSETIEIGGETLQIKSKQNIGSAFITGLEAAAQKSLGQHWRFKANAAYAYGQNQTLDEPVGGIPGFFGRLGAEWNSTTWGAELYGRFAATQDRLSADDKDDPRIPPEGTPGWYTINVRANWQPLPYFTLRVALENMLDTLYREHGSGVNGPGKNFIVGIKYTL